MQRSSLPPLPQANGKAVIRGEINKDPIKIDTAIQNEQVEIPKGWDFHLCLCEGLFFVRASANPSVSDIRIIPLKSRRSGVSRKRFPWSGRNTKLQSKMN
jgi:hypothetical protein